MLKTFRVGASAVLLAFTAIAAVPAVFMTGCACQNGELGQESQVAAVVNGEINIPEQTITDFIQSYRATNKLTEDNAWAAYLVSNDFDSVEAFRKEAIDYQVTQTLKRKLAEDNKIEVTDEEIDKQINDVKEYYGYTSDEDWQKRIASIGYTPESYREYVKTSIMDNKLTGVLGSQAKASDKEMLELANAYYKQGTLDGAKKIKCIVLKLEDTDAAKKAADRVKANPDDFDKVASEISISNEYDAWDCSSSIDAAVSDAIKDLHKGEITGVVTGQANLFIVKVEDVCNVPEGGFTNVSEIPDELRQEMADEVTRQSRYEQYHAALNEAVSNAQVDINPMPSGLPYDVDLSAALAAAGTTNGSSNNEDDGAAEDSDSSTEESTEES